MAPAYLLGIDVGTSSVNAAILDEKGSLVTAHGREYPIHIPKPGWAEQNPEDWIAGLLHCIRQCMAVSGIEPSTIRGIGLAGQMHSLVCLDANGSPVRPSIIWADQRSSGQVQKINEAIGKIRLAEYTGNPLAAGFMLASWSWLAENEPEVVKKTRWLMLPKDYVRYRMTGVIGSEPSDASSTLLFDPHLRKWSAEILSMIGLAEECLPPVFPSTAVAGLLTKEFASQSGLAAGIPVIFGGSDVSLQAFAQGIVKPGTISCTIGTGGQLFAPLLIPQHDPELRLHLFCHVLPETWHQEAAILSAGLALRWLRDGFWPDESYSNLADQAAQVEAATDGLFFYPFLAGERTPYMNARLQAGFMGVGLRHNRASFIRAVMEGVVFGLKQGIDLMISLGTPVGKIILTGGGTRHPLWVQLQADIFNQPVYLSEVSEATARGAAILAGVGTGMYSSFDNALARTASLPALGAQPDPGRADQYASAFLEYTQQAKSIVDRYSQP